MMRLAKYKQRPAPMPPPVEALQWEPEDANHAGWMLGWLIANKVKFENVGPTLYIIQGEDERSSVMSGDYVLRDEAGKFSAMTAERFTTVYERARQYGKKAKSAQPAAEAA